MGQRIALCHEWATTFGGSEQVAQRLAEALDIEDVYLFAARPELARRLFPAQRVHVHRMGTGPAGREHWQRMLPIMPQAWSHLDLDAFDVVVTSSHACTNAIHVRPGATHISYCHTPMRYAWEWRSEIGRVPFALRPAWPLAAAALRRADRRWAGNVDVFVANSNFVASRIRDHYGREAEVVYPPVDTSFWTPGDEDREDFFLVAGRLVAYKRAEEVVRAAAAIGARLIVAGDGPERGRLMRIASQRIEFIASPSNEELRSLYRRARALVNAGVEDFGMTMVEAQSCGTPVVALGVGGALEIVEDGLTGITYADPAALPAALADIASGTFVGAEISSRAKRFDARRFDDAMRSIVAAAGN